MGDLFLCEAAMCMWEHALYLIQSKPEWQTLVEGCGYGELRLGIMELAPLVVADWHDDYNRCFDWDFVPDWMRANIVIDDQGLHVRPDRVIP